MGAFDAWRGERESYFYFCASEWIAERELRRSHECIAELSSGGLLCGNLFFKCGREHMSAMKRFFKFSFKVVVLR